MKFRWVVFCLALSISNSVLSAQPPKVVQRHGVSWNRYYLTWSFHPAWTLHQEVDYRFWLSSGRWHQLVLHTHLHYAWRPEFEGAVGITRSENGAAEPTSSSFPRRAEWRTFQEFHHRGALSAKVTLQHRYRIEQRFFSDDDVWFFWRGRYRAQLNWLVFQERIAVHVSDEVFLNWGRGAPAVFDQNRFYVGASGRVSPQTRLEMGYLLQWQPFGRPDRLTLRDIFRISVYHQLKS